MLNKISNNNLTLNEKISLYNRFTTDFIKIDAIFSDCSKNFVIPCEPAINEDVQIKIRTAKDNLDKIYILVEGESELELVQKETTGEFDYYFYIYPSIKVNLEYSFKLLKNNSEYYYDKRGFTDNFNKEFSFKIIPGFKTPDWAKGAVMYQIYVDRFFNGDTSNDIINNEYAYLGLAAKHIDNWYKEPENMDVCNFYGGDLKGVMDKMSYLKNLGVEAIYFCPIFVSPSNHKYDIQDYDYIDPHIGVIIEDGGKALNFEKFHNKFASMYIKRTTDKVNLEASNKLMCELIKLAHDNGIKVILDGVFNHCGAFNKWLDKENFYSGKNDYPNGAYKDKNSVYHNYFRWYDDNWPNNDCYDAWWGHDNHPKLNFEDSKKLFDYIINIGEKWVSEPFNADGWRLDVAADLGYSKEFNHLFWNKFREAVKTANPNAIILAEHYGDPKDWLQGDQWDSIMNYDAFMEPITWFLTGMEKHSEEFKEGLLCNAMAFESAMRVQSAKLTIQSSQIAMNELSNHDHSRFLTRTNMQSGRLNTKGSKSAGENINKNIFLEAITFQMTWPGAPTVYYGDEAGLVGWTDPDNRRTYPWGKEDSTLLDYHKYIIAIHKKYEAFRTGSVNFLYSEYGIITYARWDFNEKFVIILNNNKIIKEINIPVWKAGISKTGFMESIVFTGNNSYSTEKMKYDIIDGYLKINLPPFSSMVLREYK